MVRREKAGEALVHVTPCGATELQKRVSTRQPRKRALGHARALVNLSLSGREIEKQCYCTGERGSEEREREYMMHALLHPTGHAMLQIGSSVQQAQV